MLTMLRSPVSFLQHREEGEQIINLEGTEGKKPRHHAPRGDSLQGDRNGNEQKQESSLLKLCGGAGTAPSETIGHI